MSYTYILQSLNTNKYDDYLIGYLFFKGVIRGIKVFWFGWSYVPRSIHLLSGAAGLDPQYDESVSAATK